MSRRYADMTLPELAVELRQLGAEHKIPALNQIADAMKRRRNASPTKPSARKATDELKNQIVAFAKNNIGMSQREIGHRFGVNAGRVSEALYGKRGA